MSESQDERANREGERWIREHRGRADAERASDEIAARILRSQENPEQGRSRVRTGMEHWSLDLVASGTVDELLECLDYARSALLTKRKELPFTDMGVAEGGQAGYHLTLKREPEDLG
jgi:plasmid stabilization system protein ParE